MKNDVVGTKMLAEVAPGLQVYRCIMISTDKAAWSTNVMVATDA